MWIEDAGGAPPAGPGIPGPGKPVSVLTAMRFHCITAVASAVAGGAADAPTMPVVPRSAPTATAMTDTSETDRLCVMFSSLSTSRGQALRRYERTASSPPGWESILHSSYLSRRRDPGSACLGPRHEELRQRRRSAANTQLGEDVLEVLADGRRLDPQLARDLGVGQSVLEASHHVALARGQLV